MKHLASFVLLLMSLTDGCVLLIQEESKKADTSWDVARNTASLGQKYRQHEVYTNYTFKKPASFMLKFLWMSCCIHPKPLWSGPSNNAIWFYQIWLDCVFLCFHCISTEWTLIQTFLSFKRVMNAWKQRFLSLGKKSMEYFP